jgi:biopolymer transport protein ExbD
VKVARLAARGSLEFNMTPMIDVTFLLIIFFITSSHLAQQEVQLELDLPHATSGRNVGEIEARRVTVNVLEDGRVLLGSQAVQREELERRIRYEQQQVAAGESLEVRIRSDRSVPYQFVEPILLACAKVGVWNVSFSVVQGP